MAQGPHSHWEQYFTRVRPKYIKNNHPYPEALELICIQDGLVFHETPITYPEEHPLHGH